MSDRFFYKSADDAKRFDGWLKGQKFNSYSFGSTDRNGNRMIGLSWDHKPDSDWSKYDKAGLVVVLNADLFDTVKDTVERALNK